MDNKVTALMALVVGVLVGMNWPKIAKAIKPKVIAIKKQVAELGI